MRRFKFYLIGIFLLYFQISFLNLFEFYRNYVNVDLVAIFIYATYIYTEAEILDLVIVLGLLSDVLTNSLLGIHALLYFVLFISIKFVMEKFSLSNFFKYIFVILFGMLHSIIYTLIIYRISVLTSVEFSLFLLFTVFVMNLRKSSLGWFD